MVIHGVWHMGVRQPKEEKKSKGDMLVVHGEKVTWFIGEAMGW